MTLRDGGENRGTSEGLQRESRGWRMESKASGKGIEKMVDGIERPSGKGEPDKVGWLGGAMEEDQKKPMEWACARQCNV